MAGRGDADGTAAVTGQDLLEAARIPRGWALSGAKGRVDGWFAGLLGAYLVGRALLRLMVSPVLTIDDSRELLFAQTLEPGYLPRQPPLYNWLIWAGVRGFGVGLPALLIVKYSVLGAAYAFLYAGARHVLGDARRARLATFSLLLMVPVNWVAHEALTHSVAALAATTGTFYALLRLGESGGLGAYLRLGLALGLGFLAKFSFGVAALALLTGALTVARVRRRLLHPRILLALGLAALVVTPYAAWFARQPASLVAMYADEVGAGEASGYLAGVGSGLYYLTRVATYYLAPLALAAPLAFRGAWAREPAASAGQRLLERVLLAELGVLLAGILVGRVSYLKFRWVLPLFALCPVYVLSRVRADAPPRAFRRFAGMLLTAELLLAAAFAVAVYRGDLGGRPSRLTVPYEAVARELRAAGFRGGTIAAGDGALAGNLRLWFPEARVVRLTNPEYLPPSRGDGQCLVVWEKGPRDRVPDALRAWLRQALGVELDRTEPVQLVRVPYRHARRTVFEVGYLLLPEGRGACR